MRSPSGVSLWAAVTDPLRGRTSLSKVFWVYGLLGSLLYGGLEFFLDSGNALIIRIYSVGGFLFSIYVTVATYRCADNCSSQSLGRMARISAVLSLLLLPIIAYLDFTGALSLALMGEQ